MQEDDGQRIGNGSYAAAGFVRRLHELGHAGPVGLQCFNVNGEPRPNLRRSMDAWKKMTSP